MSDDSEATELEDFKVECNAPRSGPAILGMNNDRFNACTFVLKLHTTYGHVHLDHALHSTWVFSQQTLITRTHSLPHMSLLQDEQLDSGGETSETGSEVVKPLLPKFQTTLSQTKAQFRLGIANSLGSQEQQHFKTGSTGFKADEVREQRVPQFSILHAAAISGDRSGLAKIIAGQFCNIDLRDKFGRTPLMFAALADYPECIDVLVKYGADLLALDRSARSAMAWAAHHGNTSSLKTLMNHVSKAKLKTVALKQVDQGGVSLVHLATRHPGARCLPLIMKHFAVTDVNVRDFNKRTPLHWAASQAATDYVKLLLKQGASCDVIDVEGKTPLHWAASSEGIVNRSKEGADPVKTVRLLIQADPRTLNWQDYEGRTPLHLAAADSSTALVSVILEHPRVQINALDNNSRSALHWAALLGKSSTISLLLDKQAKNSCADANGATALHYAVQAGMLDAVETLMRRPGVFDIPDLEGRTALMWAASMTDLPECPDIIRSLCRHGSDHAHQDQWGWTTLHVAVASKNAVAVEALIVLGCSKTARDADGNTPLCLAAQLGHRQEAVLLLRSGKRVISTLPKNMLGQNPIHQASQGGHFALVAELLCDWPLAIDDKDDFGRTSLILASYGGYVQTITLLIDQGAEINFVDNEYMTALHWSVFRGHLDSVRVLLERGAEVNKVAFRQTPITALDIAHEKEHREIEQCLVEKGALGSARLRHLSATRIQSWFRGFQIQKTFRQHRDLLVKHEQLRARKRGREFGQKVALPRTFDSAPGRPLPSQPTSTTAAVESVAGHFLGHVVEATHYKRAREDGTEFVELKKASSLELPNVSLLKLEPATDGTSKSRSQMQRASAQDKKYSYNLR